MTQSRLEREWAAMSPAQRKAWSQDLAQALAPLASIEVLSASEMVGYRVKTIRKQRGLSAQKLAERCKARGMPSLNRDRIANIENGRRGAVSVEELLVLALVLDVAPVHLLIDPEGPAYFMAVGNRDEDSALAVGSRRAREWIRGHLPITGQNGRLFLVEVPEDDREAFERVVRREREANTIDLDAIVDEKAKRPKRARKARTTKGDE